MSANPYEQLLPYWLRFCEDRRNVEHERQEPHGVWLITVGGRNAMYNAHLNWERNVASVCGLSTTIEWPEHNHDLNFFSNEDYVEGPCLVGGIMLFTDDLPRLVWKNVF